MCKVPWDDQELSLLLLVSDLVDLVSVYSISTFYTNFVDFVIWFLCPCPCHPCVPGEVLIDIPSGLQCQLKVLTEWHKLEMCG